MNGDLLGLLAAVRGLRVAVVGDAILDRYLTGVPVGMCREAPVPTLDLVGEHDQCGGAANVAANLRSLGAEPRLLAVVGADTAGQQLRAAVASAGVGTDHLVTDESRATVVKRRVLAQQQMLLRLDEGSKKPIGTAAAAELAARLTEELLSCDLVIACDYGYGTFVESVTRSLARSARRPPLAVDSRTPAAFRPLHPAVVKPNYAEAVALLGEPQLASPGERVRQVADREELLLERSGADIVAVTLDRDGAVVLQAGRPSVRTYATGREAETTVGAGDTFTAAIALALAAGADPASAAEFASAAAGTVVRQPGTAICDPAELRRRLAGTGTILPGGELPAWLTDVAGRGYRVVFTNGCFDILHGGHVSLLSRAKAFGELLVVGVNADESVRRLKGPSRPVIPLAERMRVLAALGCVDVVVPFDADSPTELIERLRPEVYVKGDDYTVANLPEAPLVERLGGRVELLSTVDGRSTTKIIRDIHALSADGRRTVPDRKGV
ncbi:D-beta-D-heptose 7-phosphate kinase / D-beta-D-heptose 1-phosphate adenosyltransferase [Lentzea xinjiangensis]|uniref:Bifunctional protein HldE n=1 Tax=Lentzea xinjiangensis TaxID=402600 RepID=A0A1H9VZX9_9PSEU|nr:D-glycero-beta-D-manno-heptose 1-phosphate adenylyltransferase [Lentzea xinjiangensis]SES26957.1 D-beta-D-heptose 7-phosphate kinase / D-beta-D-heptose 1-phosphate adenosyltransferase [Lentzea xinjiangensis]